jgi:hypothetical protein
MMALLRNFKMTHYRSFWTLARNGVILSSGRAGVGKGLRRTGGAASQSAHDFVTRDADVAKDAIG